MFRFRRVCAVVTTLLCDCWAFCSGPVGGYYSRTVDYGSAVDSSSTVDSSRTPKQGGPLVLVFIFSGGSRPVSMSRFRVNGVIIGACLPGSLCSTMFFFFFCFRLLVCTPPPGGAVGHPVLLVWFGRSPPLFCDFGISSSSTS